MGKTRRRFRTPAEAWDLVAQRGLSAEAVRMAREMGMNPRKLLGNMSSVRDEPWKAPAEAWVRDLYTKRRRRSVPASVSDGAAET